ncbi:VOC family protein [Planosporangium flavigriseum]|uniref:VOC family protein n=1 Tax=Planosporangium flavigriseum TaxID=373681 RepID=UPI00197B119D|nr:VOC family protein [Planosporangium flavigriseum]
MCARVRFVQGGGDEARLRWWHGTEFRSHRLRSEWTPVQGDPRVSLAFRCDSPEEVDRTYGALTEAGYHGYKKPWDAFWGQRYAVVHDPDGNSVDLFAAG